MRVLRGKGLGIFKGLGVGVRGYGLGVRGQGLGLCVLVFGGEASEHGPIIVVVMAWVRQKGEKNRRFA